MSERRFTLPVRTDRSASGPPISPKPFQLKGTEYLKDNLLEDDEPVDLSFETPSSTKSSAPHPQHDEPDDYELSRHRLVVAIDYGTTFTGRCYSSFNYGVLS